MFIVKTNIHLYDNLISHLKIGFHFHSNLFSDQFLTFFLEVHLRSDGPPICDVDLRPTSTSLMAIWGRRPSNLLIVPISLLGPTVAPAQPKRRLLPRGRAVQLCCVYTIQLNCFPSVGLYSMYIVQFVQCVHCILVFTLYSLYSVYTCRTYLFS